MSSVEIVENNRLKAQLVDVAVPRHVHRTFHYTASDEFLAELEPGSVVQVPFASQSLPGFVLGFPPVTSVESGKLKEIEKILVSEPMVSEQGLEFYRWLSEYYCHPIGEVMACAFPKIYWTMTDAQKSKAMALSADPKFLSRMGLLPGKESRPTLTDEQQQVLTAILDSSESRPLLLQGVTGSGKTEVYMSALEQYLKEGKGGIILVPEIALTPQLLGRFTTRFPGCVAVLHSDLTPREKYVQWERLRQGEAKVVIGARSAIFAPVANLGLIVVDEEHDTSYKQEDSFKYHARDVAVLRGKISSARVILGSATPSLESLWNVQCGKYAQGFLTKRIENRSMPRTVFVDLKNRDQWHSPSVPWMSKPLVSRIENALRSGQQVLLYLNRLGFAHFLYCNDCGHTWRCRSCDVALTYYRNPPRLKCHYCSSEFPPPTTCEKCEGTRLEFMGLGTEQVEMELAKLFPGVRIGRMDRSVIKTRKQLSEILNRISQRELDIVIGTQMVVKGHDFPGIALVGILVADASLNLPDFRAHERTFQIITQVSGRAGRGAAPGEVVIQTLNPEHPVLLSAAFHRGSEFVLSELASRRQFGFPPFARLAMLRFQHRRLEKVESFATEISRQLRGNAERLGFRCTVIGPVEAPVSKIKNLYRWQCLVRSDSIKDLRKALLFADQFLSSQKSPVQMSIDVDPISSL